jgi:hypothetical protein
MRKYALPIIIAVISFVIFRSVNPEISGVGIALSLILGAAVGVALNKLLDKADGKGKTGNSDKKE